MTADQDSRHQSQPRRRMLSIEALLLNILSSTHTSSDQLSLIKPLPKSSSRTPPEQRLVFARYCVDHPSDESTPYPTQSTRYTQFWRRSEGHSSERKILDEIEKPRETLRRKIRRSKRRRKRPTHLSHGVLKEHVLNNAFIEIVISLFFEAFDGNE